MRLHVSVDPWAARLFAVLSLTPIVACGGTGGGATGGAGGGTSSTGSTSGTHPIFDCAGAQPELIDGKPTGYVDCTGGWTHREAITTCPNKTPTAAVCGAGFGGAGVAGECSVDTDCTAQPYGHCGISGGPGVYCGCQYGCTMDSECSAGSICVCGDPVGHCVQAECKSDADCGPGRCATYTSNPGCGGDAYACQTDEDECTGDGDCMGTLCTWTGTHRVCVAAACTIGRPFLVAGQERLARLATRGDWCGDILSPSLEGLDGPARDALAARWTKVGLMEHASVAAFARFVLQLLSLGAPPDLVRDAQAAMADETRHAEVCFALASAYAGAPVGPGRLAIDRAMDASDVYDVLVTVIHEGCVGETVAAIEAAETAARAQDPAVRAVLLGIAEDETRHAELAWRYVRWALAESPSLAHAAEDAFAEARSMVPVAGPTDSEGDPRLLAHGLPGEGLRAEIRRRALEGVVGPCARALLDSVGVARDEPPPTRRVGRAFGLDARS